MSTNKPKILLLHGALGQDHEFIPLIRKLQATYDCTALNFSGHGDATSRSHMVDLGVLIEDLVEFFHQNGRDYFLFGYSLGGFVALNYCLAYPAELPKALMTYATKFDWTEEIRQKFSLRLDPAKIEAKGGAFATLLQNRYGPKWPQLVRDTEKLISNLRPDDLKPDALASIKLPLYLAVGEHDPLVSRAETQAMAAGLPTESLVILKNSGHELDKTDLIELCKYIQLVFK
jgi:pimeloyl-ACP methyl ester carboxylesterase